MHVSTQLPLSSTAGQLTGMVMAKMAFCQLGLSPDLHSQTLGERGRKSGAGGAEKLLFLIVTY